MADTVDVVAGSATFKASTEEITTLNGGAVTAQHVQRVIQAVRTADGTAVDVTAAAPLPVTPSLAADAATQTTAAAILAKLSADPATQTTLASILSKLIAAPATEAKQDSTKTVLDNILLATDTLEALLTAQALYLDGLETALALVAPAANAEVVTPHNSNNLSNTSRGIYVGGAGDVSVQMSGTGTAIVFKNVPAGTVLPYRITRVNSTSTTATDMVSVY